MQYSRLTKYRLLQPFGNLYNSHRILRYGHLTEPIRFQIKSFQIAHLTLSSTCLIIYRETTVHGIRCFEYVTDKEMDILRKRLIYLKRNDRNT